MGICIESAATSFPRHRLLGRGALHLSDVAARRCLERGHHHASELELVVNVGLYKDRGIAEPALATLIQEDLGANLGHPHAGDHGTFSFDILAGGNGVVTAAYLLDGFVAGATAKLGLIVAGDAWPRGTRGVPFTAAGGAVLLAHAPGDVGFDRFAFETFPEDAALFEVATRWQRHAGLTRRGRHVLQITEAPAFRRRSIDHGIAVARELLAAAAVTPAELDVVVASQYPRGFGLEVARGLGIPEDRVPRVADELAAAHTAGPIAALELALRGALRPRRILFVTAGAGLTIGAALYHDARARA